METETKKWWQSRGIIGPAITMATVVLGFFGVKVDAATSQIVLDQTMGAIGAVTALGGSLLGIIGRLRAKKTISA